MNINISEIKEVLLDKEGIKALIPHREPFLLLDSVLEIRTASEEQSEPYIICKKEVLLNDWFFNGHFPGHPIMPGVLIIEALAQAAAVYAIYISAESTKGRPVFFTAIEQAKFRQPVHPGCNLILYARLVRKSSALWKFQCHAEISNKLVAEATITATIAAIN